LARLSVITRQNVYRDRRVQGREWKNVYGGYFSDERVINSFLRACEPLVEKLPREPSILYVCSGTGLLGERLCAFLRKRGFAPRLTLVDSSEKQLRQNMNPRTEKIVGDLLRLRLGGRKFDLIIMRSSLDYFYSPSLQRRALKRVASLLKLGGVFVNQCCCFPTLKERALACRMRLLSSKIGRRLFHWPPELPLLYRAAGFEELRKIGEAPPLRLTEKDHVARYGVTREEIAKIRCLIRRVSKGRFRNVRVTQSGYETLEYFPIYAACLKPH